jgi:hypothetical protein
MRASRIAVVLLALLVSLALYPQATSAPAPAGPAVSKPEQDPRKDLIPDQATPTDLLQAYKDLSDQFADRGIAVKALTRQLDSWKKRAEAAEAALEVAKKQLEEAKGKK